jgi:heparan-alpha-glucosaminide N-acetyltransferase
MAETSKLGRLVSLDAFRGLIMLTLAGSGFGLLGLARNKLESDPESGLWNFIKFQTDHPEWLSNFNWVGVSYWDLIQPSFMFMVGVAMPFSYTKRLNHGDSYLKMLGHALARSVILILLGVFLESASAKETNWTFVGVLSQIGLGYLFVFLLMGRPAILQFLVGVAVLVGYWYWFIKFPTSDVSTFAAHFAKNANAASDFDLKFLNWFPRSEPFKENSGGYATLNFIPSAVTMLMGVMSGELLLSDRRPWRKVQILFAAGAMCMVLGLIAGNTVCPIVKRIWTPSWVLFSGAYVLWILGAFYAVCDAGGFKRWTYLLAVLGANSILLYVMARLLPNWTADQLLIHFGRVHFELFGGKIAFDYREAMTLEPYKHVWRACSVMLVFWLLCAWLYRQKTFVRI